MSHKFEMVLRSRGRRTPKYIARTYFLATLLGTISNSISLLPKAGGVQLHLPALMACLCAAVVACSPQISANSPWQPSLADNSNRWIDPTSLTTRVRGESQEIRTKPRNVRGSAPIIYVGDQTYERVNVYDAYSSNPKVKRFIKIGHAPLGLCVDRQHNLYVLALVYQDVSQVEVFPQGASQPSRIISGPELGIARTCAVDDAGNLWVSSIASYVGQGIWRFAPGGGQPIGAIHSIPDPFGLGIDSDGNLTATRCDSMPYNMVAVFKAADLKTASTEPLTPWYSFQSGASQPSAIGFDRHGTLYVVDFNGSINSSVDEFKRGSRVPTATISGLSNAEFLTVSQSGRLFVGIRPISGSFSGYVAEYRGTHLLKAQITDGLAYPGGLAIDDRP